MSTVSWHDRHSTLADELVRVFCSAKIWPVVPPEPKVRAHDGQGGRDNPILFVSPRLNVFVCTFRNTDLSREVTQTFFVPSVSAGCCRGFFLPTARVTCRGHVPRTDTAGFTAMTLFQRNSHSALSQCSASFTIKNHYLAYNMYTIIIYFIDNNQRLLMRYIYCIRLG